MLEKSKSFLAYHIQAALYSLNLLCCKPIANLTTIIVIATALTLPALFWVFADNMNQLTASWKRSGHISLYLKPSLSVAEENAVLAKVRAIQGVAQTLLKSPREGLTELTSQEGMKDIMSYLPENPLPAVINVTPAFNIDSPDKLDFLSHQLRIIPKVDSVKIDMEWIGRLDIFLSFLEKLSYALLALLALAIILIIGNTLRLAIQNRQEEIQILKLIGATDPFIMRPFLYFGVWYGLVGAVIAILLVNIFILSLSMVINQLTIVYQIHYPATSLSVRQVLILIVFSIILGWIGACLSVKKQLASIEPYKN